MKLGAIQLQQKRVKKLKGRTQQCTYIFCEGKTDVEFIKRLKSLYSLRGHVIRTWNCRGGDLAKIISKTERFLSNEGGGQEESVYVFVDEQTLKSSGDPKARKTSYRLLVSVPICIEGLLIKILGHKVDKKWSENECKKQLDKVLHGSKRLQPSRRQERALKFIRELPKDKIEKARKTVPLVDKIVKIFTCQQQD